MDSLQLPPEPVLGCRIEHLGTNSSYWWGPDVHDSQIKVYQIHDMITSLSQASWQLIVNSKVISHQPPFSPLPFFLGGGVSQFVSQQKSSCFGSLLGSKSILQWPRTTAEPWYTISSCRLQGCNNHLALDSRQKGCLGHVSLVNIQWLAYGSPKKIVHAD